LGTQILGKDVTGHNELNREGCLFHKAPANALPQKGGHREETAGFSKKKEKWKKGGSRCFGHLP